MLFLFVWFLYLYRVYNLKVIVQRLRKRDETGTERQPHNKNVTNAIREG